MLHNGKHLILFATAALTIGTVVCFCGNNLNHRAKAGGVLSMQECLSCHNGVTGKAIAVCLGKECLLKKNHSLMNIYPPPGKERWYAPASEVERAGGFLENGKTTCLSCHDLTKPPPRLIREGDKLCLICHIDKQSINQ